MEKFFVVLLIAAAAVGARAADVPTVLIYTHNGLTTDGKKGYVHDNIATSVKAIEKLGVENGFKTAVSDDPAIFSQSSLKKFSAVIFANSNNRAFDTEEQRKAFQDYIHGGGGFIGIHSASGSERDWSWFSKLLGGTFAWHPPLQKFTVQIVDANHPATSFFTGKTWDWEDEFYTMKEQPTGVHVLLAGNIKQLKGVGEKGAALPDLIPLAWCHEFEGARSFYTALGHKKEYYSDATYLKHLAGGIRWVLKMGGPAGEK